MEDFAKVWLLRRGWISFLAVQVGVWMMEIISSLADFAWGQGLLVLPLGTGFYLSVKHRFFSMFWLHLTHHLFLPVSFAFP